MRPVDVEPNRLNDQVLVRLLRARMERDRTLIADRREFLSAALVGLTAKAERPVSGGRSSTIAYSRSPAARPRAVLSAPSAPSEVPVVIVGGGIAGLSAAWRLDKRGFRDFVLLEMEPQAGGNARWGENEITRLSLGGALPARSEPEADPGSRAVRGARAAARRQVGGAVLCFSPQERLFLHGRWQEGLEPEVAATRHDREQYRRFESDAGVPGYRPVHDSNGAGRRRRRSTGSRWRQWMEQQRISIPPTCAGTSTTPAATITARTRVTHRPGRASTTSPRANTMKRGRSPGPKATAGFLRKLLAKLGGYVRTNSLVYRIQRSGGKLEVLTPGTCYIADRVIYAAPTFTARYVVENPPDIHIEYSPWFTANVTLDRLPEQKGMEVAWDNVVFDSPSLGYVNATHMSLRSHIDRTVWTFYWALADSTPLQSREWLLAHDWNFFKEAILNDLGRAHPDIRQCVSHVDVMRIGHAMARPTPGAMFSPARQKLATGNGPIYYANSDVSGFSIFEEAQYRGVKAADSALHHL